MQADNVIRTGSVLMELWISEEQNQCELIISAGPLLQLHYGKIAVAQSKGVWARGGWGGGLSYNQHT